MRNWFSSAGGAGASRVTRASETYHTETDDNQPSPKSTCTPNHTCTRQRAKTINTNLAIFSIDRVVCEPPEIRTLTNPIQRHSTGFYIPHQHTRRTRQHADARVAPQQLLPGVCRVCASRRARSRMMARINTHSGDRSESEKANTYFELIFPSFSSFGCCNVTCVLMVGNEIESRR